MAHAAGHELATAIDDVATLVASGMFGEEMPVQLATPEASLTTLDGALDARVDGRTSTVAEQVAAAVCLRRMVDAARPFVA